MGCFASFTSDLRFINITVSCKECSTKRIFWKFKDRKWKKKYMYITWAHMDNGLLGQECEMGLWTEGNAKWTGL